MALTNCPECGGLVSDNATACPHCGYQIKNTVNKIQVSYDPEEYHKRFSALSIASFVMSLIVLLMFFSTLRSPVLLIPTAIIAAFTLIFCILDTIISKRVHFFTVSALLILVACVAVVVFFTFYIRKLF